MFTLSGGHLFVLYDGAVQADLRLVDTRHEQTATFAAEGWAKVTRRLGCAALTAGPGVTNGVSAMTAARDERLADGRRRRPRAAAALGRRVAAGARPRADRRVGREARGDRDVGRSRSSPSSTPRASRRSTPHRGPTFVDIPLDVFGPASVEIPAVDRAALRGAAPDPAAVQAVADARRGGRARRCCSPAATCTGRTPKARCVAFAERRAFPVFVNGMGRGTIPADHELAFSRARSVALKEADLVLVAGTPLDFRLGFGRFGDAQVVHLCDAATGVGRHADLAASTAGDLLATFTAARRRR